MYKKLLVFFFNILYILGYLYNLGYFYINDLLNEVIEIILWKCMH